jgi:Na+/proline symporter
MHRLSAVDLSLVAIYLVGITLFGLQFRSKDRSLKNYFLADRKIPWWAIALSIVAAETSTLTIISVPGLAYTGDWGFLEIVLGYLMGRIVVCIIFLPRYFRGELLTAYEVIGERFGPRLHKLTAFLFLFLRAAAEGVRVFAVSIVVGIAIGTGDVVSIAIICVLTLIYTLEGGMTAVIWTDVVQMALYIAGTIVSVILLGHRVPGGWHTIHTVASAAGKLTIVHFAFTLSEYLLGWSCRGLFPDHGKSWYRSTHGAAAAGGKEPTRIPHRLAEQRRRYPDSVRAFSRHWYGTLLFLR